MYRRMAAALLLLIFLLTSCGGGTVSGSGGSVSSSGSSITGSDSSLSSHSDFSGGSDASAAESGAASGDIVGSSSSDASVVSDPEPVPMPSLSSDISYKETVFLGDSIMAGIEQYVATWRGQLSRIRDATFITSINGVTISGLVADGSGYRYNGEDQTLAQILPTLNCKRIFLLLGLNDLSGANPDVDTIIENYATLVSQIKEIVPGVEVIIMTNTPKQKSDWLPDYTINRSFDNALIDTFVSALITMCNEKGIPYVDVSTPMKDAEGYLPEAYCSDEFVHLTSDGAKVVVKTIEKFVKEIR